MCWKNFTPQSFLSAFSVISDSKTRFSGYLTRDHFGIAAAQDNSRNSQYLASVELTHRNEQYEESSIFNSCESDPVIRVFGI